MRYISLDKVTIGNIELATENKRELSRFIPIAALIDKDKDLIGFRVYEPTAHEIRDFNFGELIKLSFNGHKTSGIDVKIQYKRDMGFGEMVSDQFQGISINYDQDYYGLWRMSRIDNQTKEVVDNRAKTLIGMYYDDETGDLDNFDRGSGIIWFITMEADGTTSKTQYMPELVTETILGLDIINHRISIDCLREYKESITTEIAPLR